MNTVSNSNTISRLNISNIGAGTECVYENDTKFVKAVPEHRQQQFAALGWRPDGDLHKTKGYVAMNYVRRTTLHSRYVYDTTEGIHQPWVIQSALIRRPLGRWKSRPFMHAIELSRMDSDAFSTGALPRSLYWMATQIRMYQLTKTLDITAVEGDNIYSLHVLGNFNSENEYNAYIKGLKAIRTKAQGAECVTGFEESDYGGLPVHSDVWWDIENHVVFSFDKIFMHGLKSNLIAQFELYDHKILMGDDND